MHSLPQDGTTALLFDENSLSLLDTGVRLVVIQSSLANDHFA